VDTVLLKRLYVLVFIEHGTRRMHLGGVTALTALSFTSETARIVAPGRRERVRQQERDAPLRRVGALMSESRVVRDVRSGARRRRRGGFAVW
jgi:hypothetical protein